MTLNGQNALYCRKDASFRAHCTNLNDQRQKCRPMTQVSGNMRFMRIFAGIPWAEALNDVGGCRRRLFVAI